MSHDLLGVDPATGESVARPPLLGVLKGRHLAAVCPAALTDLVTREARDRSLRLPEDQVRRDELDVRLAVSLDDMSEIDNVVTALGAQREAYDAVLVLGDLPARLACVQIARELEVAALDLGLPLARFLHPGYNARSAELARRRWELEEYLRRLNTPAPDPPHALEGRLVQSSAGSIFYVERGQRRLIEHPALLALFDHEPGEVEPEVLNELPRGAPLAVVHERLTAPFVLLDGRKRAIELGITLADLDDFAIRDVPETHPALRWSPAP